MKMQTDIKQVYDSLDAEGRYLFDERAAVYEYDGGMDRDDAEREALRVIMEGRV